MDTLNSRNSADVCRANGWLPGTRLVGDEGYGPTVIELTGIGRESVLAKIISHNGKPPRFTDEGVWSLSSREWSTEKPKSMKECADRLEAAMSAADGGVRDTDKAVRSPGLGGCGKNAADGGRAEGAAATAGVSGEGGSVLGGGGEKNSGVPPAAVETIAGETIKAEAVAQLEKWTARRMEERLPKEKVPQYGESGPDMNPETGCISNEGMLRRDLFEHGYGKIQFTPFTEPTLRDQFAMAALTGLLASCAGPAWGNNMFPVAETAYAYADQMMEHRSQQDEKVAEVAPAPIVDDDYPF